jgi:diguanylate cyclase (GGDEF)-like protein
MLLIGYIARSRKFWRSILAQADDDDDILALIDETDELVAARPARTWRVLIVDDDQDVHQATEFALANTPILGRLIHFLHAYSAADAKQLLQTEKDIAVILLDVVMEREDAGLKLVRTIREELGILEARIILRTGQPGYAPEIDAIRDYDINDYKTKSELSRNRLYTTLTAAIRSYDQIHAINASRRGLDMIIRASSKLMARHGAREFAAGIITQISGLLGLEPEGIVCAHDQGQDPLQTTIIAAAGHFAGAIDRPLAELGDAHVIAALGRALGQRASEFGDDSTTLFFAGESGHDMAAYIETNVVLDENDRRLLEVFCTNITVSLDNVILFGRLNDHAYNDQLLHISNRLAFVQAVDAAITADRQDETVALVDIDHFSHLNDALGHRYGDALLIAVTSRLRSRLAGDCQLARVAGDTFGILGNDSELAPNELLDLFRAPFQIDGADHSISATIGLVRLNEIEGSGADAVKAANIALNRAKESARGEYFYYTRDMEFETRSRVQLLQDLRVAFDRDRLFVVYQPQVDLQTRRVIGVEALLRWRTDEGKFVPPDQFIPLAESSGLIIALGAWVMRTACAEQRSFLRQGVKVLRMAVNVSVTQFRHPNFLDTADTILAETGIDPDHLELEITESVAMLDADFMLGMLQKLKERRLSVAIDDFGTGFSSLSYLERLRVDRLKIDRSFVSQMAQGESSRRIVETIVQLGRSLDLDVIAEGVETDAEADALASMGCHEGQGYLFARPMPSSELLSFLLARQTA